MNNIFSNIFTWHCPISGFIRKFTDDPAAILNNPLATAMDDNVYVPNQALVPPVDTAVEIILRRTPVKEGD